MLNYQDDEAAPVKVSRERTVIGMVYLVLVGALLSGVIYLIGS